MTLRSSHKPFRRSNTKFHTMRHLALTLPAPANRACLVAVLGGRSRETRSLLFAIERLARNRSQTPNSMNEPNSLRWQEFHNAL